MGRHDLRNLRVHDFAALVRRVKKTDPPLWYDTVTDYPPSAALVRTLPVQHHDRPTRLKNNKKPSKMFMPQTMGYTEDRLRSNFFKDHPWELARPRILVENDGQDGRRWDWGREYEVGRPVCGESVVQRQHWLMTVGPAVQDPVSGKIARKPLSRAAAYDKARKELYERRHEEEMDVMIQREEALAVDAHFGKSAIEIGQKLEGDAFDSWKEWALQQATAQEQARSAAYGGTPSAPENDSTSQFEAALDTFDKKPKDAADASSSS